MEQKMRHGEFGLVFLYRKEKVGLFSEVGKNCVVLVYPNEFSLLRDKNLLRASG